MLPPPNASPPKLELPNAWHVGTEGELQACGCVRTASAHLAATTAKLGVAAKLAAAARAIVKAASVHRWRGGSVVGAKSQRACARKRVAGANKAASSAAACPALGGRTPTSFTTARRPRTRTAERLLAGPRRGRRQAGACMHPGVVRGARTRGGRPVSGARRAGGHGLSRPWIFQPVLL